MTILLLEAESAGRMIVPHSYGCIAFQVSKSYLAKNFDECIMAAVSVPSLLRSSPIVHLWTSGALTFFVHAAFFLGDSN